MPAMDAICPFSFEDLGSILVCTQSYALGRFVRGACWVHRFRGSLRKATSSGRLSHRQCAQAFEKNGVAQADGEAGDVNVSLDATVEESDMG
jgi:hypothetical protein